jgi:hypothetical protein
MANFSGIFSIFNGIQKFLINMPKKFDKKLRLIAYGWVVGLLGVWLYVSIHCDKVEEIPLTVLTLIAILLGADVGLEFAGSANQQTQDATKTPALDQNPLCPLKKTKTECSVTSTTSSGCPLKRNDCFVKEGVLPVPIIDS